MKVYLNNAELELESSTTLSDFLSSQNLMTSSGIAVAVNDAVISKSSWNSQNLQDGDKIVVITATAGG